MPAVLRGAGHHRLVLGAAGLALLLAATVLAAPAALTEHAVEGGTQRRLVRDPDAVIAVLGDHRARTRTRARAPTPLPRTAPGEPEPAGPVEDGVFLGVRAWGVPVHPPPVPTPRPPPTGAPTVRRGGRGWPRPGRRTGSPPHRPYHPQRPPRAGQDGFRPFPAHTPRPALSSPSAVLCSTRL